MNNSSYIQIYRDLLKHPSFVSSPPAYRCVLFTILTYATHSSCQGDDHGKLIDLKPGQFMCTIRQLAELSNVHKNEAERALSRFSLNEILRHEVRHKKTIITILWGLKSIYDETRNETKVRQERDTKEEDKNQMIDDNHPDPSFSKVVAMDDSDLTDSTASSGDDFFLPEGISKEEFQNQHNVNYLTFRHKKHKFIQIEKSKLIEKFEPKWTRDEIDTAIERMQKQDPEFSGSIAAIEKYLAKTLETLNKEESWKTKKQRHKNNPKPSKPSSTKDSGFYLGPDTSECPLAKFAFQKGIN